MNGNQKTIKQLYNKYSWLKIRTLQEDYVAPNHYNKLLKPYSFNNKTDIEIFNEFVKKLPQKQMNSLELGTGTGRVTEHFLKCGKIRSFTGVDLSKNMIDTCINKFNKNKNADFIKQDSLEFLSTTTQSFDFVFSLWSLSHSIHQHMEKIGVENGYAYTYRVLFNFLKNNLKENGFFFLIHFDSTSEEQIILRKILKEINPLYYQGKRQSLSKRVIDFTLESLAKLQILNYEVLHLCGDPIIYKNIDEALETYLVFHLESHFNDKKDLPEVFQELNNYLSQFKNKNQEIVIKPGCFIYKLHKHSS